MFKMFWKYRTKAISYFKSNIEFNAGVHVLGGIGVGIMIASPLTFPHPVRWALVFLALSLLGHVYAVLNSKPAKRK
jgi:hypothetical protein